MSSRITFQESLIIWIWSSLGYTAAAASSSSALLSPNSAFVPRLDIAQPILSQKDPTVLVRLWIDGLMQWQPGKRFRWSCSTGNRMSWACGPSARLPSRVLNRPLVDVTLPRQSGCTRFAFWFKIKAQKRSSGEAVVGILFWKSATSTSGRHQCRVDVLVQLGNLTLMMMELFYSFKSTKSTPSPKIISLPWSNQRAPFVSIK